MADDVAMLSGSNSYFIVNNINNDIITRTEKMDIHPVGILVGANSNFDENNYKLKAIIKKDNLK